MVSRKFQCFCSRIKWESMQSNSSKIQLFLKGKILFDSWLVQEAMFLVHVIIVKLYGSMWLSIVLMLWCYLQSRLINLYNQFWEWIVNSRLSGNIEKYDWVENLICQSRVEGWIGMCWVKELLDLGWLDRLNWWLGSFSAFATGLIGDRCGQIVEDTMEILLPVWMIGYIEI